MSPPIPPPSLCLMWLHRSSTPPDLHSGHEMPGPDWMWLHGASSPPDPRYFHEMPGLAGCGCTRPVLAIWAGCGCSLKCSRPRLSPRNATSGLDVAAWSLRSSRSRSRHEMLSLGWMRLHGASNPPDPRSRHEMPSLCLMLLHGAPDPSDPILTMKCPAWACCGVACLIQEMLFPSGPQLMA